MHRQRRFRRSPKPPETKIAMDAEYAFEEDSINRNLLVAQSFPNLQAAIPLRASLHQQENLIRELDSQIVDLRIQMEAQMDVLRGRRRAVVASSVLKKALLAPVRRLAPEILSEIFGWCIDESLDITLESAPILLLQVCSQWRQVAIDTPRLWTQIVMRWSEDMDMDPRMVVSMYLHNSRSLPIDIYMSTAHWRYPKTRRPIEPEGMSHILSEIWRSISSHVGRIQTLQYESRDMECMFHTIFPPDRHTSMPLLQNLRLIPFYGDDPYENLTLNIIAPDLRILHISDRFLGELREINLLNLKILSITWQNQEARFIIDFLTKFRNLSLDSFALIQRNSDLLNGQYPELTSSLESFLVSSTLKELTIHGMAFLYEETKKFLMASPTLESLSISFGLVDLDLLCPDPGDSATWILPRLSSISILGNGLKNPTTAQVAKIINSRAINYHWALDTVEGFRRLTHIHLSGFWRFDESTSSELRSLTRDLDGFLCELPNSRSFGPTQEEQVQMSSMEHKLLYG